MGCAVTLRGISSGNIAFEQETILQNGLRERCGIETKEERFTTAPHPGFPATGAAEHGRAINRRFVYIRENQSAVRSKQARQTSEIGVHCGFREVAHNTLPKHHGSNRTVKTRFAELALQIVFLEIDLDVIHILRRTSESGLKPFEFCSLGGRVVDLKD